MLVEVHLNVSARLLLVHRVRRELHDDRAA